jgi:hypothetical protein
VAAQGQRRPPALKHGLSSLATRREWSRDVLALADALIGPSPRESQILGPAREAAEELIFLRRVRLCRLTTLEEATLARVAVTDRIGAPAAALSRAVKVGEATHCHALREELCRAHRAEWLPDMDVLAAQIFGDEVAKSAATLRSLADYERRAASRLRKALRRLDYERVEAERRRVAMEVAGRRGAPRSGVA